MIKRLATHGADKDAWCKTEDYITSVIHEDTMLTLENTSEAIKRDQTYLDHDMTISGTITKVPKADTPASEEILALKAELEELKVPQTTVTHNKHRRDGVPNNATVTCQKCGGNHSGACWFEGEQKREEDLVLLKEADIILASKKNNKPSSSEIKALKAAFIANNERY